MGALAKRINALHEASKKSWEKYEMESRIETLASHYHHGYGGEDAASNIVHVNMVYPQVRTDMSSMFAKRPEILARARRVHDEDAAKNAELMTNYLTRFMRYSAELREWLFWSRLTMYGVMKLGMEKRGELMLPMMRTVDPRD